MREVCVGPLKVEPNEKKEGFLTVASRAASDVMVPIVVVNGANKGPILSVIASEHGCEYCGIEAAVRLCSSIHPEALSGTLIIIPVLNVPAFDEHSLFVCPIDGVNLYAVFPGSLEGSVSYAMAHTIFNEVILKSDYAVHLHGGDANEALVPFTYYAVTGNKAVDELSETMARLFPVDYVMPMKEQVEIETRANAPKGTSYSSGASGTLYYEASTRGIPATMIESGRDGKAEEEFVMIHYNGIINIMRYLKMLKGKPSINRKAKILKNPVLVSATKGGIFHSKVELHDVISKGQIIGEVRDLFGNVVESIRSPIDGLLICKVNYAAASPYPTSSQPYLYYITQVES